MMVMPNRNAVLADIAKTIRGQMTVALVIGNYVGVMVKACDKAKMVFLESDSWPRHPNVRDQFALELQGRGFIETGAVKAGKQATLSMAGILWQPVSHWELMEKCQRATKGSRIRFGQVEFDATYLQWILKKAPRDLCYTARGVFMATIPGLFGDYRAYVRGHEHYAPRYSLAEEVEYALEVPAVVKKENGDKVGSSEQQREEPARSRHYPVNPILWKIAYD